MERIYVKPFPMYEKISVLQPDSTDSFWIHSFRRKSTVPNRSREYLAFSQIFRMVFAYKLTIVVI